MYSNIFWEVREIIKNVKVTAVEHINISHPIVGQIVQTFPTWRGMLLYTPLKRPISFPRPPISVKIGDKWPITGLGLVLSPSDCSFPMLGELSLCRYDYTLGSDRSVRIVMLVWELHLQLLMKTMILQIKLITISFYYDSYFNLLKQRLFNGKWAVQATLDSFID